MFERHRVAGARSLCLVVLAATLFPGTGWANELIINGGFELPNLNGALYSSPPIGVGDASLTGWEITAGNVEIVSSAFAASYEGNQWLDLDGTVPGTLQQTFQTTPGDSYRLSFAYANNPNAVSVSARVDVLDGVQSLLSENVSASGSTFAMMNYALFNQTFLADSMSTTLQFTSTDPPTSNSGLALDAVSVQLIPEPSTRAFVVALVIPFAACFLCGRSNFFQH